jgi:preprotein translocase SecE subunit
MEFSERLKRTMGWRIYRPNDGILMRRISTISILLFTGFGCLRWYQWLIDTDWWGVNGGVAGAAAIGAFGLLLSFYVCFVSAKASTFLIEVENELRKVTWPNLSPWFSTESEVWASTYVVITVLVIMAALLYGVDLIFWQLQRLLFGT